jgi:hypothetical protein
MDFIQAHAFDCAAIGFLCGIFYRLGSIKTALRDHTAQDRELFRAVHQRLLSLEGE